LGDDVESRFRLTLVLVVRVDLRGGILPKPRRSVVEIAGRMRDRLHTCIQRIEVE
jgi:hypothetical protein